MNEDEKQGFFARDEFFHEGDFFAPPAEENDTEGDTE